MKRARLSIGFLVVAMAFAVVPWLPSPEAAQLEAERERWRASAGELERLRAERERLAAVQPSADELARLRADHAALRRLRAEVDALQAAARADPAPTAPAVASVTQTLTVSQRIAAGGARNVGRATPAAAIETVVAAMNGGDRELLGASLGLSTELRARVVAILAGLPEARRAEHASPESFIAAGLAREPALGEVTVRREVWRGNDDVSLEVNLTAEASDPKTNSRVRSTTLALKRAEDGWKLFVPESAVEKYGALAQAAEAK